MKRTRAAGTLHDALSNRISINPMNRMTLLPLAAILAFGGCDDGGRGSAAGDGIQRCDVDEDCDPGLVCNKALLQCHPVTDPGADGGGGDAGGQGGEGTPGGEGEGEGETNEQPHVVTTVPVNGTRGVTTGEAFEITVKFSAPMNGGRVAAGIYLTDDQGESVDVLTNYEPSTRTATITAEQPLEEYGVYRLQVSGEITSADGRPLREEIVRFSVGGNKAVEAAHLALASEYAPIVFQDTTTQNNNRVERDLLVAYDFDGKWKGDDKAEASTSAANKLRGGVYFSVIQSESHHFIHYVYYHPQDTDSLDDAVLRENSMKGAVVVVAKTSGAVRLLETWSPIGERFEPYAGPGTDFLLKDGAGDRELVKMPEEWLTDGKRYHAFITEQRHDSCIWDHGRNEVQLGPYCRHEDSRFTENSGIQYTLEPGGRVGEAPDFNRTDDCDDTCFPQGMMCRAGECHDTTYQLHNFTAALWVRRAEFADESIWATGEEFQYDAPPSRVALGTGFPLPTKLRGDDGKEPNSGEPPWAWEDGEALNLPRGSWFLDPAWALAQRVDMPGEGWSDKYCWNPYLGIDNRAAPGCN